MLTSSNLWLVKGTSFISWMIYQSCSWHCRTFYSVASDTDTNASNMNCCIIVSLLLAPSDEYGAQPSLYAFSRLISYGSWYLLFFCTCSLRAQSCLTWLYCYCSSGIIVKAKPWDWLWTTSTAFYVVLLQYLFDCSMQWIDFLAVITGPSWNSHLFCDINAADMLKGITNLHYIISCFTFMFKCHFYILWSSNNDFSATIFPIFSVITCIRFTPASQIWPRKQQ